VRVAPRAQHRVLTAALVFVSSLSYVAGCGRPDPSENICVNWTLDPSPPVVGEAITAHVTLRDAGQAPVTGARLRLEGMMSHPGMAPVIAAVVERGDGNYDAALRFSMAGDWILLLTGELPGGEPFKKQIEINGVRPAS
jgi:YtkA-like protein